MQVNDYLSNYLHRMNVQLVNIDKDQLEKAYVCIKEGILNNRAFFGCGIGGSGAISEHFTCDHMKGVFFNTDLTPKFYSLTSNVSLLTALANDNGYDKVFSQQLKMLACKDDILIVISASGNSPNVIQAIEEAKRIGMTVISFTGFDGGYAKDSSDISLHVPVANYGIAEDSHQILMHVLFQSISINNTVDNKLLRL